MNESSGSEPPKKLVLRLQGYHIPSKKNRHYPSTPSSGRPARVLLDEKVKERIERITRDFVYQLLSESATTGTGTATACSQLSRTLSLLPEDDSWKWVAEHSVRCEAVPKGMEGAEITVEII